MRSTRAHTGVAIVGAAESRHTRHPRPDQATDTFIADALVAALADAGIDRADVDGLA